MSNDLIRRSDVLNLIDKMYMQDKDLMRSVWVRDSIKGGIEEIPTAYDIDKVVEELRSDSICKHCLNNKNSLSICEEFCDFAKRLMIVKEGGSND